MKNFDFKIICAGLIIAILTTFQFNIPVNGANSIYVSQAPIIVIETVETPTAIKYYDREEFSTKFAEASNDYMAANFVSTMQEDISTEEVEEAIIELGVLLAQGKLSTDITKNSGLSANDFDNLIEKVLKAKGVYENSKLIGIGQALYEGELANPNVNGLLTLATFSQESGWGHSNASLNKNNLGGIMQRSGGLRTFESTSECVSVHMSLINRLYIGAGRTTLLSIGQKYCPPTYTDWARSVQNIMDTYTNTLLEM